MPVKLNHLFVFSHIRIHFTDECERWPTNRGQTLEIVLCEIEKTSRGRSNVVNARLLSSSGEMICWIEKASLKESMRRLLGAKFSLRSKGSGYWNLFHKVKDYFLGRAGKQLTKFWRGKSHPRSGLRCEPVVGCPMVDTRQGCFVFASPVHAPAPTPAIVDEDVPPVPPPPPPVAAPAPFFPAGDDSFDLMPVAPPPLPPMPPCVAPEQDEFEGFDSDFEGCPGFGSDLEDAFSSNFDDLALLEEPDDCGSDGLVDLDVDPKLLFKEPDEAEPLDTFLPSDFDFEWTFSELERAPAVDTSSLVPPPTEEELWRFDMGIMEGPLCDFSRINFD